ncbi:MAG TPA: KGG domain-containing protein [Candidatus Thermoplasmatota archaeon]|nr:KGG domain-containing protein [Candidatus Thermoplasmatota archaeon]
MAQEQSGRGGSRPVESESDRRLQDNLDPERRSEIGRKGGEMVSQDREHMAEIGKKGGEAVSQDREHMAEIGKKGGETSGGNRRNE